MRPFPAIAASLTLLAALLTGQSVADRPLRIYLIDVEGGNATLFVFPSGESLLMDTGHLDAAVRDAERIMSAVTDAGLQKIDHLVTTHWHLDHFGGMAELARQIPILEFIDHGPNVQPKPKADDFLQHMYPQLYHNAKHTVVQPGDTIPVRNVDVTVVASAGKTIRSSLAGGGMNNPYCADFKPEPEDRTENAQSIGIHIRYGKFQALHLGDLSTNKEFDLMCPVNRIGRVDLFFVSHHGQPHSNNEVLVNAIAPRVALMNNGIDKGGEPSVMKVIYSAPGLENLWQLHFSILGGQEYAVPGMFIANTPDNPPPLVTVAPIARDKARSSNALSHDGTAYWIKVAAEPDGSFRVTNSRTGFSKPYPTRAH